MSVPYVPTAIYHNPLTLPSPGDAATAASVNTAALKFAADNAEFVKSVVQFLISGGASFPAGPISIGQAVTLQSLAVTNDTHTTTLSVVANAVFQGGLRFGVTIGPGIPTNYTVSTQFLVVTPNVPAPTTYTIVDDVGVDGACMLFVNLSGNQLSIQGPSGQIEIIRHAIVGASAWVLCMRVNGQWIALLDAIKTA